jgi:WhiB family redox-sensing transcriptional regulator
MTPTATAAPTGTALAELFGCDPDNDSSWRYSGLCTQTDPELFFPNKGESTKSAKKVCGQCEVRAQCLAYALEHDERHGVWGGLSERERRRLKRPVPAAAAAPGPADRDIATDDRRDLAAA